MISLSGNTVGDVMMTIVCDNCDNCVPIPSSIVKKHMQMIKSQKLRLGMDNHCFRTRKIMLHDKLELQGLDLEFMSQALKEMRYSEEYEGLLKTYVEGQSRNLSLVQEAVYLQKVVSDMVEDSTTESSATVRRHLQACESYDEELKDIRRTLEYLKKENANFKRVQIAAMNLATKMTGRILAAEQKSERD